MEEKAQQHHKSVFKQSEVSLFKVECRLSELEFILLGFFFFGVLWNTFSSYCMSSFCRFAQLHI